MVDHLPWLVGALEPLLRKRLIELYGFSTVVDSIKWGKGGFVPTSNTQGTDINCVLSHLLSLRKNCSPAKVVIITDGYTGKPDLEKLDSLNRKHTQFFVGIIGSGNGQDLEVMTKKLVRLPPPN